MIKRSIRNKLIVLLLLTTIVPLGSSIIFTYFYTKQSLQEQTVQESVRLLHQGKINIETQLREINNFTLSFYNNPEFLNYLKKADIGNENLSPNPVHQVLNTLLYSDSSIKRVTIGIVGDKRLLSVSKSSTIVYSAQQETNIETYMKARQSPYNIFVKRLPHADSFILYRAFRNVPSDEILAYISLEIKLDKFEEFGKTLYQEGAEEFYVFTPEGDFIYHSGDRLPKNGQDAEWVEEIVSENKESGKLEWKDETFQGVMLYNKVSDSVGGWLLVKRMPYTSLFERAYGVVFINILFGLVGLTLVILATLFVSFKITSPIKVLLKNIKQVEKGNMEPQFDSLGDDEIGVLGQRFKSMLEKINYLINREYKLQLENKTNQLKVLQSQINPHFLYNTLQSIGTEALKSNAPQIYKSLTDLSQIMRYSMNMEEEGVPLKKEINYIKSYLLLQKQRFGDDLDYHIAVDEDALEITIPKMTLQPIVENYFKHGYGTQQGKGFIQIHCKRKKDFLYISIKDNGSGATEETLKGIQSYLEAEDAGKGNSNIGLKNVYVRLKLYYAKPIVFQIKNRENGGFLVLMKLPLEMGEKIDEGDNR